MTTFITLFDILKDNFNEVTLDFLSEGIKILDFDECQTILSYIKLDSNKFSKYHSRFPHRVNIDLIQLHKFFKTIQQYGTIEIFINENDRGTIVFETTTGHNLIKSRYTQQLLLLLNKIVFGHGDKVAP